MKIAEILSKLQNVRKNSKGWIALCPSHNDAKQSLSISESNENILLKCFAGCAIQTIISALGIEMKDLFKGSSKNMLFRSNFSILMIFLRFNF